MVSSQRPLAALIALGASGLCSLGANGADIVVQMPVSGGGTMRASQLWQDPGPDGNDLDSDTVCWQDFTIGAPVTFTHMEWWGSGACERGFRIEVWPQDPNTIAYQPLGVFYYGGWNPPPQPTVTFDTNAVIQTPGPGGITHYSIDLAVPFTLPGNTETNPRWFIGVIGLTAQPYAPWNWAKGTGGSNNSFRWLHGSAGPVFQVLPEGRALVLADPTIPCPADLNGDHAIDAADLAILLGEWGFDGSADLSGDGVVNAADLATLLGAWGGCP